MVEISSLFDATASKRTGIVLIVCGAVAILAQIVALVMEEFADRRIGDANDAGSGIWAGVFYVAAGIVTLLAGKMKTFCMIVAGLTMNVVAFIPCFLNFVIVCQGAFVDRLHRWKRNEDYTMWVVSCAFAVMYVAVFLAAVSIVWSVVVFSQAIHYAKKPFNPSSEHSHINTFAATKAFLAHGIANAAVTGVSATCGLIILAIVDFGLRSADDYRSFDTQVGASSLAVAPFHFLTSFLGWRSCRRGQNCHVFAFLVLNVICVFAPFAEAGGSIVALTAQRDMIEKRCREETTHHEYYYYDCDLQTTTNGDRFEIPLVCLNAIIVVAAVVHLAFAIWGIVIASKAVERDQVCAKCCAGDCGSCCEECGSCCGGGPDHASATGDTVRYVVSNTTNESGQRVVVLMPSSGANAGATAVGLPLVVTGQGNDKSSATTSNGTVTAIVEGSAATTTPTTTPDGEGIAFDDDQPIGVSGRLKLHGSDENLILA